MTALLPRRKATGEAFTKGAMPRGLLLLPGSRCSGSDVTNLLSGPRKRFDVERKAGCALSELLRRMDVMLFCAVISYEPGPGVGCAHEAKAQRGRQLRRSVFWGGRPGVAVARGHSTHHMKRALVGRLRGRASPRAHRRL